MEDKRMKKLLQKGRGYRFTRYAAICTASVMLLLYGMTGRAAQTGAVNNDNVNVRTQASAESERVCKLSRNTELAIVDQTTGNDGNVWYSVTFTHEGEEKSGWIRSDMVTVSETEETEGESGGETGPVSTGSYSIQEPVETYPASDVLSQTAIQVGEENFTAWVVDAGVTGGRELYLVWASDGGSQGWFYYDPQDGTFQREMGQFSGGGAGEPEGMIQSLQDELGTLKEESAKSLSQRLYTIIGLGALSLILLIIVIVLAIKLRGTEYEYYDEDEDEDDDDYDDYEEPRKKRGGLFRRKVQEEEEDDDDEKSDFDDLLIAVKKKWAEEEEKEAYVENYGDEDYEEDDFEESEEVREDDPLLDEELPEIDMSAVLEIEEEAVKEKKARAKAEKPASLEDEEDDFDIEILDLDDLDL